MGYYLTITEFYIKPGTKVDPKILERTSNYEYDYALQFEINKNGELDLTILEPTGKFYYFSQYMWEVKDLIKEGEFFIRFVGEEGEHFGYRAYPGELYEIEYDLKERAHRMKSPNG